MRRGRGEAPSGFEPENEGFANLSLSHLGTAPERSEYAVARRPSRPVLALVVIARDEEDRLPGCLASVPWASERVVLVDPRTRDATAEVARRCGARVALRPFDDFAGQRNAAAELASAPWTLFLDADERLSAEASDELRGAIGGPHAGLSFPRRSSWLGRELRYGRWGRDRVVRAARRGGGRFVGAVHERLVVDGPVRALRGPLLHDPYRDWLEHLATIDAYASAQARASAALGARAGRLDPWVRPALHFVDAVLRNAAWRDGPDGLVVAGLGAASVHLKWSRLRRMSP